MKEESTYNEMNKNNLPDYLRINSFLIPEGYFADLENSILANIAEQKLKEKVKDSGFEVPPEYFAQSEQHILSRLSEQRLRDRVATDGYQVPQSYFEELSDNIRSSIALEQIQPSTDGQGFGVPAGYFESLSSKIMDKVAETPVVQIQIEQRSRPTVVPMTTPRRWIRYTSAAAMVLVGLGSYLYIQKDSQSSQGSDHIQTSLHDISQEEIVHYLAEETDGVDLIELASYAEDDGGVSSAADGINKNYEIDDDLKDKEIEEYLNYML